MKSQILGPDGQPFKKELLTREIAEAQLTGTRSVWAFNSIASYLTPVRLADVLTRANQGDTHDFLTLAEEMEERDMHYAGQLGTRKRSLSGKEIEVLSASEDARDEEIAQAVRDFVSNEEFPDLIEESLDALGKSYSCVEIIWETSAKQWMPQRFEWRDPRFFKFDQVTGRQLLLLTDDNILGEPLPAYKFITHFPRIKCGLPIRGALARMASVAYMCKSVALTDWMTFAELFGMPVRIGKYGANATPAEKATLRNAVANIGSDAAAIIPESMMIEFIETARASGGEAMYERLCDWLDRQISKGVLGQTMTADAQSTGLGSNNASVHNDVREDIMQADARQLAKTLNRDLIRPFVDFNYGPQQRYPRLRFPFAEPEDIAALTSALKELVPLGLRVGEKAVRDKLGLPEPQPGEEVLRASGSVPIATDTQPKHDSKKTALNREQPSGTDALDALVDESAADWQPQMQPIIDPVRALAERSQTADEFIAGLPALLDEMDDTELVQQLAIAFFKSRWLGDATD